MAFTGKATYTAGTTLPELAEDVSDLIGIISPYETPLLDALGDPMRDATSTHHEWLEDALLPNKDAINDSTIAIRILTPILLSITEAGSAWEIRFRSKAARSLCS